MLRIPSEAQADGIAGGAECLDSVFQSLKQAPDDGHLLARLIDELPLGVSLQDADGRVRVVNALMAGIARRPAQALVGHLPFALMGGSSAKAERLRRDYILQFDSGETRTRTIDLPGPGKPCTLLVTSRRVTLGDAPMMLTTTLDITDRRRLETDLARRAHHDELTGLPNRGLMQDIVGAALAQRSRGGQLALVFIDLDSFKQINDYYSHGVGDALLLAVAERVRGCIRGSDTLARISGDEFLLLIDPLPKPEDLASTADRLLAALKRPFHVDGHELSTSATIGTSVFPLHGDSYESLRRCADSALMRAKRHSKGCAVHFDEEMGRALAARMETEQRLRVAVRERRFRAAFQPKVRIASGQVDGFEALIRWVEADGRVHAPGSFIEPASELGLLDDITRFVVDDVARELPALQARFGGHVSVSVNVSARQAGDEAFMRSLVGQLAGAGIARHVVVELTEDALLATQRFQHGVLPLLREAGVRVSIDDFGTGYSSLSMLADLTADEVKVDRAFITAIHERPRSQGILRAVESLCRALGIEVVAEGVETAAELAYLRDQTGIALAQGYLYSKPQFIETLLKDGSLPAP